MAALTLNPYVHRYVTGRAQRGEISRKTAVNLGCRLAGLAASFGEQSMLAFGKKAINRWLTTISHHSPATRRAYLSTVGRFCRWLVAGRIIPADPTADVPRVRQPRTVPRALRETDVRLVLGVLPNNRARCIVALMVSCGLRRAEVAGLRIEDYDVAKATVTVKGKFDHERVVPVPPEAVGVLRSYMAEVGESHGPLLRSMSNPHQGLQPATVGRLVVGWMREAGVKQHGRDRVSGHSLRHSAASDVLDKCHDLRVVQQMLGQIHLSSTEIYLRRADLGRVADAMAGRDYYGVGA